MHGDICDRALVDRLFERHAVRAVVHLAAESHVDRSIHGPESFLRTNVTGTFVLLEAARRSWTLDRMRGGAARHLFLHVSTDEVYGALEDAEPGFCETTPYRPNSPYSASKAAADHFVRAYFHTYGLPTVITNCSNNYGPRHFPEKLIPLMISNALQGEALPVYGEGMQVRDWLYVGDHCAALRAVLENGREGEKYNIGGNAEWRNVDVVNAICALLDERRPRGAGRSHADLITYVRDRPGHDWRYAIDAGKIAAELGWRPRENFESGLARTVDWYLDNPGWLERARSGAYRGWVAKQYA